VEQPFKPLQQPLGSNSCLSTCVIAVLRFYGVSATLAEAREWCGEDIDGCVYPLAIAGLEEVGFEVAEVRNEAALLALFEEADGQDVEPVIVFLQNPRLPQTQNMDHAVVMLSFVGPSAGQELVEYMDPLDGEIHQMDWGFFLQCWEHNGFYSFLLRPN
jgi:ABC-type bacteriocin/lantibiotic exporter with double-glycine peptidase domain